jgi:hypothetical protein
MGRSTDAKLARGNGDWHVPWLASFDKCNFELFTMRIKGVKGANGE